jgi:hypothetical protein
MVVRFGYCKPQFRARYRSGLHVRRSRSSPRRHAYEAVRLSHRVHPRIFGKLCQALGRQVTPPTKSSPPPVNLQQAVQTLICHSVVWITKWYATVDHLYLCKVINHLSTETTIIKCALGTIVSCDRVFVVKTLWVESGLEVPSQGKEINGTLVLSSA